MTAHYGDELVVVVLFSTEAGEGFRHATAQYGDKGCVVAVVSLDISEERSVAAQYGNED